MEGIKQRVIVYVDGFNFYYGLKSNQWRKYYWLDMVTLPGGFVLKQPDKWR